MYLKRAKVLVIVTLIDLSHFVLFFTDVGQDLAILFGFSCLVTVLAIVCWVILLIWIRKWITGQWLS